MLELLNKKIGIETKHSFSYHSQGNGIDESAAKRVERSLRNYVCNDGWKNGVRQVQGASDKQTGRLV